MDTTDAIRIKRFLKKGIQAKILSRKQLAMLKPEHLQGVEELKGIDLTTITKTLQQVQTRLQSKPSGTGKSDICEEAIKRLIEEKAGSFLDQVKDIYAL